jgi:hypothetical protein
VRHTYVTPAGTGFLPKDTAKHHQQHILGLVPPPPPKAAHKGKGPPTSHTPPPSYAGERCPGTGQAHPARDRRTRLHERCPPKAAWPRMTGVVVVCVKRCVDRLRVFV